MDAGVAAFLKELALIVGVIITMAGGYYAFTRNTRDSYNQALSEATATINMLEKQNELLEKQNASLEDQRKTSTDAWQKRETEWRKVEQKLEKRISDVEADYRNLVLTVTTMGFCANAATCGNYNPGDRREPRSHVRSEG